MRLVMYTDGSTKISNPGPSGWGSHGYLFKLDEIGKPTGKKPSSHVLTDKGYHIATDLKKMTLEKVSPIKYVDMYGSVNNVTNNCVELLAITRSFEYILQYVNIKEVHLLADSKYALLWLSKGLKDNINTQVNTPNKELVEYTFVKLLSSIVDRGVKITFEHVYGHTNVLGNEYADVLANMGSDESIETSKEINIVKEFEVNKNNYWKRDKVLPDILTGKRLYCLDSRVFDKPTYEGIVYEEDVFIGTNRESGYTVVRLNEPIEYIEILKGITQNHLKGVIRPFLIYLDTLASNRFLKWFGDFKEKALRKITGKHFRLYVEKEIPVVVERRTLGILPQAIKKLDELNYALDIALGITKDEAFEVINVTDTFYDWVDSKKCYNIKPDITSRVHLVNHQYELKDKIIDIPIALGSDICNRNVLKRLEKKIKSVKLVLQHRDIRFTFHTVIELVDDTEALWSSMTENDIFTKIVKKTRNKPYKFK